MRERMISIVWISDSSVTEHAVMAKRKSRRRYSGPDLTADTGIAVGDVLRVRAEHWDERGYVTAESTGAPVTVLGAIPGETVQAEVVKVYPERIAARAVSAETPDADRVVPRCRYFGECSGCQWQHVRYERQLEMKRDLVTDALSRYAETSGSEVSPTIASPKQFRYRNHARFSVGRGGESGVSGYVNADSRRFVRVDECAIMDTRINQTLDQLQGRLNKMTQWSVRVGVNSGDATIQPLLPAEIQDIESGRQHYVERINDIEFTVAASSFFQVNSHMIPVMIETICEMLQPKGDETLIDLYCGVGTFSCLIADRVGKVVGIEESASAVATATRNAAQLANVSFVEDKAEAAAQEMAERGDTADFVIVDPPRIGCDTATLRAVTAFKPRKVVMVSCEPTTFARDLAVLIRDGFKLVRVQPMDMFPHTRHVESVALLSAE